MIVYIAYFDFAGYERVTGSFMLTESIKISWNIITNGKLLIKFFGAKHLIWKVFPATLAQTSQVRSLRQESNW